MFSLFPSFASVRFTGQPPHHRHTDDGGQDVSATSPLDFTQGDWVWKN